LFGCDQIAELSTEAETLQAGNATLWSQVEAATAELEDLRARHGLLEAEKTTADASLVEVHARAKQLGEEQDRLRQQLGEMTKEKVRQMMMMIMMR
jgi:chromosome segregation ATPase